jgi:signal transduction histidine kinase
VQFIGNNLEFLQKAVVAAEMNAGGNAITLGHVSGAIEDSIDGIRHIGSIVSAVKAFGHPGGDELVRASINSLINNTLVVVQNTIKESADVQLDLGVLPEVFCSPTNLYQVFLNLFVNAADAIAETGKRGTIMVSTRVRDDQIVISVSDTGAGMTADVRSRAFEPMFTTKTVGKGSGLGLAFVWSTIVDQHGGTIECSTTPGIGTTFILRLPFNSE